VGGGVSAEQLGLRERKRIATRRAIQRAAIGFVIERGVDGVTVDEISQAAQVSTRTFFNYFPSKEAAIVGDVPALPDAERVRAFVEAGPHEPILDGIRDLLIITADYADDDERDIHRMRRTLLKNNPQLFALRMASMIQLEHELLDAVVERIERDMPELGEDERRSRGRLVTLVAFAAIRHAWACWAERGGTEALSDRLRSSFAQLQNLGNEVW
jgi:AcrR family transcriptional regulator